MKRFLIILLLLLSAYLTKAQIFAGGQGDGATMSCVPPKVKTLTNTEIVCVGDTIIMAVHATGTNLQYIWQKFKDNFYEDLTLEVNARLRGLGTDTLFIIDPDKKIDDGTYRCLVKNSCDQDTSLPFFVDLNEAPQLDAPLALSENTTFICANAVPEVSLIASISSPANDHRYYWVRIDTLAGTETILPDTTDIVKIKISGAALEAQGRYVVTGYNVCGSVSDTVFLPVYRQPEVAWRNVDTMIVTCVGELLELSLDVKGGGDYNFMLEKIEYDYELEEWYPIWARQYSSASYKNPVVRQSDEGYYRWIVSNQCEPPTETRPVYVSVEGIPSYTKPAGEVYQFPDTLVCEGGHITMMCKASGSGTKYYWMKDGVRIPGSDSNVLSLTDIKPEDEGNYICVAYNYCMRQVYSRQIRLTVKLRPRFLRDPYLKKRACVGDTLVRFGVAFGDIAPVDSLRWCFRYNKVYDNGHYINSDNADFRIKNISESDIGIYEVKAYNECGESVSAPMNLFELALPVRFQKGVGGYDMLLCAGAEQKLSVAVTGSEPIHYKWILNEHTYQTDTNFVTIMGQDVSERNKYTVYAYNACGSATDTGWIDVERFDHFKFVGEGEYCQYDEPTGKLTLCGSQEGLTYRLYRDYGELVETFQGTGDTVRFEKQKGGIYYITAENPATQCVQEMNGRPEIIEKPAPERPNFFVSSYYCLGNDGATLVLATWEQNVFYQLQRSIGRGWEDVPYSSFTGGLRIYSIPELNSPPDGEPRIFEHIDYGRFRVEATGMNGCKSITELEDSIYMLPPPSRHGLIASKGDSVNCNISSISFKELTALEVEGFEDGSTYTLYKNGVPDPDRESDRTSPIKWERINEGEYFVHIVTKYGCEGNTNKVRIKNVEAPLMQSVTGDGSQCVGEDPDTPFKTLTINNTEAGVTYNVYRADPYKLWETVLGDGLPKEIIVPATRATYYVTATDPSGNCTTTFEDEFSVLSSDFQVATNPGDIFLESKGLRTRLHADITGTFVQPLDVQWTPASQLEKTGLINYPNTKYHKQHYWPFCPCADKHDSNGGTWWHSHYGHGPSCNATNCPFLYHAYNASAHGCTYMGTEYAQYRGSRVKWYDLYFCRDQVQNDHQQDWYQDDVLNPYRDPLTTPVNEDRLYTVTVTDGAGCTHSDQVSVRVVGGTLRANITYGSVHAHYAYPFCPCSGGHYWWGHNCTPSCNENNCPRLYHSHSHAGCYLRKTEYIDYHGSYQKYYDLYNCCTDINANDTIVYKNDELFFCSNAKGGDYNYKKTWSFRAPGDNSASWSGWKGDTVVFKAKQSGWLFLRVTSMGQEVRDSIWIEVYKKDFSGGTQGGGGDDPNGGGGGILPPNPDGDDGAFGYNIDSLYLCKGQEARLYVNPQGGNSDITYIQWWGEDITGPNTNWWIFTPTKSGWYYNMLTNDGDVIKDSVYILVRERPSKPELEGAKVRCVIENVAEEIKVKSPTDMGVNYVLERSKDGIEYTECDWELNSAGGAVGFEVKNPRENAGFYRVKAESVAGDHTCPTYSDEIEFITPPAQDEIKQLTYCEGQTLRLQLNQVTEGMSYSILSNRGTLLETISYPLDFFDKPMTAGTYRFVRTRKGKTGVCADTSNIEVKRINHALLVDVIVNDGAGACEGDNTEITIPNSENGVDYYLEAPSGGQTKLFTGTGGEITTTITGRGYGTYQLKASKGGCPTLIDWFTFNRKPAAVPYQNLGYCYPYGFPDIVDGVSATYNNLEDGTTYILMKEGTALDTIIGPGMKSFHALKEGEYKVISVNNESQCFRTANLSVKSHRGPKAFPLYADCGVDRMITLDNSEKGVTYRLYRDQALLKTLKGTGSKLEFGIYNVTGVYTAIGETPDGCSVDMEGRVQIYEIGHCKLQQYGVICTRGEVVDLVYPCSKPGWKYFIEDISINPGDRTETFEGYNGELRWTSIGDNYFAPKVTRGRDTIPGIYVLYGKDACDEIPLDTIVINFTGVPKGTLKAEEYTDFGGMRLPLCKNEFLTFFVEDAQGGVDYTLTGVKYGNYTEELVHVKSDVDAEALQLGRYREYDEYHLIRNNQGCESELVYEVDYTMQPLPEVGRLTGTSQCAQDGELTLTMQPKVVDQNYYLYCNDSLVDTLRAGSAVAQFKPQTTVGRYWAIAENIFTGTNIGMCRDTVQGTFGIGSSPTKFHLSPIPFVDEDHLYLCEGDKGIISLASSEAAVEYQLFKDGVAVSDREFRLEGGSIPFAVTEPGEYSVRAFLGDCIEDMLDTITVMVGKEPELGKSDVYYYCNYDPGAVIEVTEADYGTVFELKNAGIRGEVLERDTVRYIHDTIRFNTLCPQGEEYKYIITMQTPEGCRRDYPFRVDSVVPPTRFQVYSSSTAVCEGNCTRIAVVGDQRDVEYSLMRVDPAGDYEFPFDLGNMKMGWGDRDTIWFDNPLCERGKYYVIGTFYAEPHCVTRMQFGLNDTLELKDIDSIRYSPFLDYDLHYCAAQGVEGGGLGVTVTLQDAQTGIDYYLYRNGANMDDMALDMIRRTDVDHAPVSWDMVRADTLCMGRNDRPTEYRVKAVNPETNCYKWMEGTVLITADNEVQIDAVTQPYMEFCEGGEMLLKARASGCGVEYVWKKQNSPDILGTGQDLLYSPVSADADGLYFCEITNVCGTKTTAPYIEIKVRDSVTVTPMEDQVICEGSSTVIYSQFNNVQDGDYKWFKRGGTTMLNPRGESYLELTNITPDMQGFYVCVGGDLNKGYCNVVTDTVFLSVARNTDSVRIDMVYDTICTGDAIRLSLGDRLPLDAFRTHWYLNGGIIAGATGYTYADDQVFVKEGGIYSVKLESGCGTRDLIPVASVTVDTAIEHLWHTEDKYLCYREPIWLSVRTSPMGGVTYEWYKVGTGGEEFLGYGPDLATEIPEGEPFVKYRVYYHNACPADYFGDVNTQEVNVTLATNIKFTDNLPDELTWCEGDAVSEAERTLKVGVTGTYVNAYVWLYQAADSLQADTLHDVTGDSYVVPLDHEKSGFYSCILNTDCGRMVSNVCWVRINTPAAITKDLEAADGKMCEESFFSPAITATGSDLQFRWVVTMPSGRVDTIRKSIGYNWETTDRLMFFTDSRYDGGKLKCIVWNNCGEAVSSEIELHIVAPRTVTVDPAESWLCCDSLGTVHVTMNGGDGGEWKYKLRRDDYNPKDYVVDAGLYIDTVTDLKSGNYKVTNLDDGVCNYADKVMAEFTIKDRPVANVKYALADATRDTMVCFGTAPEMEVTISGGTGPFEVTLWSKPADATEKEKYDMMMVENPFYISAEQAVGGYKFQVPIYEETDLTITVVDLNGAQNPADTCPVFVGAEQTIHVSTIGNVKVDWGRVDPNDLFRGVCELPINLKDILNPTPAEGKFIITKELPDSKDTVFTRQWYEPYILTADGPGFYHVSYTMGGTCDKPVGRAVDILIDSLPYMVLQPKDTVLCFGNGGIDYQVELHGSGPFQSLIKTISTLNRGATSYVKLGPDVVNNPTHPYPMFFSMGLTDSLRKYTVSRLIDVHGCQSLPEKDQSALVRIKELPEIEVRGSHPAYGYGYWGVDEAYNIPEGDSVRFKIALTKGEAPWVLELSYGEKWEDVMRWQDITISSRDTVIVLKNEGYYLFGAGECNGCHIAADEIVQRQIQHAPSGYISVEGLYLAGAIDWTTVNVVGDALRGALSMRTQIANYLPDYTHDGWAALTTRLGSLFNSLAVDWVFLEARDPMSGAVVDRDTCLLLKDGSVIDRAGNKSIEFKGTGFAGTTYYLVVSHRNHLSVRSKLPLSFVPGRSATFTFSDPASISDDLNELEKHMMPIAKATHWALAPGLVKMNALQLVSMSNTVAPYFGLELDGSMELMPGYYDYDVNMDGKVEVSAFTTLNATGNNDWDVKCQKKENNMSDPCLLFLNRNRYSTVDK